MKLLVIGAGMMGTAAAYDMARNNNVVAVTLADNDKRRAKQAAERVNRLARRKVAQAVGIEAAEPKKAARLMGEHDAALSAVPYFYNAGLCRAAIDARCHFADLGGNNTVVKEELGMGKQAEKRGVAIAPDCGLSPGMASILAGELMRRIGGEAEALKIYVGGLPAEPQAPFMYHLVFSVEGLINEYAEPAKILRKGKMITIEPLTEVETFHIPGFPPLDAFHTSGGTSTLPETFAGKVGECFEKTLRYRGTLPAIRALYDFGLFSKDKVKVGKTEIAPRELTARLMCDKLAGNNHADVTIMRVEAHEKRPSGLRARIGGDKREPRVLSFTMVDRFDSKTGLTSMMRTTAWPAAVVVQMLASGEIAKRGGIHQELDIPADAFLSAMHERGINIEYQEQ
ncbi:MAG: saccharopine dehydrogenase C-terminal domain-containing protein [Terriglobales bacterium]